MFKRLSQFFLDRSELAAHRFAVPSNQQILSERNSLKSQLAATERDLRDSNVKVVAFRDALGHLSLVAAGRAKCRCTCPLCKRLLLPPLIHAQEVLERESELVHPSSQGVT